MTSTSAGLTPERARALAALTADLRRIFGVRLLTLAAYGTGRTDPDEPLHTLALADSVAFADFAACAPLSDGWRRGGLAVPLILARAEFSRTLDVFPLEYGAILNDYTIVDGEDLLAGLVVADIDLRRACELQAKGLLIHLREGFLESGRDARAVAALIAASVPAFRAVLVNIVRLAGEARVIVDEELAAAVYRMIGIAPNVTLDVLAFERASTRAIDATAMLQRYMDATGRLWEYVDAWRPR